MEDGVSQTVAAVETVPDAGRYAPSTPPPPPDPNVDDANAAVPLNPTPRAKSDEPLQLEGESWDITSVSALGALRMLVQALEKLSETTGDVPPTPPVSRPSTPLPADMLQPHGPQPNRGHIRRVSSTPRTAAGAEGLPASLPQMTSPEAHAHEPLTVEVGAGVEDIPVQHAAIARRFFSRATPPFSLAEYLQRLHHYCPHSAGVYLAAATYIHHLCVSDLIVPVTCRTAHRLALAAIRVAAKAVEDNKWAQERMAKVGGVGTAQLLSLEVTLCFLLDFELFVDSNILARRMFLLQQAARNGISARGRLNDQFKLQLPLRKRESK